eukprot:1097760-Karenia_brevis.AAC.1
MGKFVELMQNENTRFDAAHQMSARLDRVYVSSPGWISLQIRKRCWLNISAMQMQADKLSDHAPVHMQISRKHKLPRQEQPITREIFDDPRFAGYLRLLENAA